MDAMTSKSRWLLAVAGAALLMTSSPTGAQDDQETGAIGAMEAFLESWLVRDDIVATLAHFGVSDRSLDLAPTYVLDFARSDSDVARTQRRWACERHADVVNCADTDPGRRVALGYWQLLGALWPDAGRLDEHLDGLLVTDPELIAFINENLEVDYVQESPFIVFYADERVALDTFDAGFAAGGYGRLADVLKPSTEHPILTMIADFRHVQSKRNGPLVTFWDKEVSSLGERTWRIQALGAFPEN